MSNEDLTPLAHAPGKSITYEIAKLLNIDVSEKQLIKRSSNDEEDIFLSLGIDCVVLNYRHPEKYKEFLLELEKLVNKNFKQKKQ